MRLAKSFNLLKIGKTNTTRRIIDMNKAHLDKLNAIALLNQVSVTFKEEDGTLLATCRGVSFTVGSYRSFDSKLKEIKRMPPQKASLFRRIFSRGGQAS
jgi:hypothetical protein